MSQFRYTRALRLIALGVLAAATVMSYQSKTFIGNVTKVTASEITAVEKGKTVAFAITKATVQTPRLAKAGDNVRITYIDADVSVASKVEVIPPSN